LKRFGSVEKIKKARPEELVEATRGLSLGQAEDILNRLRRTNSA